MNNYWRRTTSLAESRVELQPLVIRGENARIDVEVIPREFGVVVRKALNQRPYLGNLMDDAGGFKTAHDAIIYSQRLGARLLPYVEPQNLLFCFSERIETLLHAPIVIPIAQPAPNQDPRLNGRRREQTSRGQQEHKPHHGAVVLCKLAHANVLQQLLAAKQQDPGHQRDYCQVTWRELQDLSQWFSQGTNHERTPGDGLPYLKPCPFCASADVGFAYREHPAGHEICMIACNDCGAHGPVRTYGCEYDEEESATIWCTRRQPT